jgi:pimeloyl-ACP methyl ester carboxylesterase
MGSDKAFLRALEDLGSKSGHVELSAVPWILWGHSGGRIWSDVMADLHPERVVAAVLRSGAAAMFRRRVFPQPQGSGRRLHDPNSGHRDQETHKIFEESASLRRRTAS